MSSKERTGIVCAALFVAATAHHAPAWAGAQTSSTAAAAAAKENPELVGALSKELGTTTDQAAGAAGALFGLAKSRLSAADFSRIAGAVPGMDALLKAAPDTTAASTGAGGITGSLPKAAGTTGSLGSLSSAATAFSKLGISPDLVSKAVPVLTGYVTKSGGAGLGNLLGGVFK
jgi:hypothetical protein